MRRRYMKGISLALAVALTVAFLNSDVVTTVNEQDSAVVETESKETTQADSVTESAATEQVVDQEQTMQETASAQTVTSEEVSNETEDTVAGEVEDVKTETTTSGLADNAVTASDMQQIDLEDKVGVAANDAITKFIKDTNLCTAVMKAYNATATKQVDSANDLTYALLKGVALDISAYPEAAGVTTLEGLGQLQNVKSMDLSGCTKVTEILANEFGKCTFTSIELPSSITRIGMNAFKECKNLQSIVLPDTVTIIDEYAFNSCSALTKISSKKGNTVIEYTLPSALTKIGQHAFGIDRELTKVIIPSLTNGSAIASSAFAQCSKLTEVEIGASISEIPANCFTNAGKDSESGVTFTIGQKSSLKKILSSAFTGVKLNEKSKTFDLSMCDQLESIADSAFEDATNIENVLLPVKTEKLELGKNTFAKTDVMNLHAKGQTVDGVVIPDYVTSFGQGCFYGNEKMERFSFPGNEKMEQVPAFLLDGCKALATITSKEGIGVTSIGDCAFRGTAIEDTEFLMNMKSLTTIGTQTITGGENTQSYGVAMQYDVNYNERNSAVSRIETKVESFGKGDYKKSSEDTNYGSEVFTDCVNLTKIHIPASVVKIGARAFYFKAYKAEEEEVSSNVTTLLWDTSSSGAQRSIGVAAFQGNGLMTSITLPDNNADQLEIGAYAFAGNKAVIRVGGKTEGVLPISTQKVGEGAFYWCMSIPSIKILSTVKGECPELGDKIFERCVGMTQAILPKEIVEIPRHMFYDAPLKAFYLQDKSYTDTKENNITKIGDLAFMGNRFAQVDLSNYTSLEEIGAGAYSFMDMIDEGKKESKDSVITPYNTTITDCLLKTVILPKTVTDTLFINSAAFAGQYYFDTMYQSGGTLTAKQIYIPDYVISDEQQGLFAYTGVKTVRWQADETGVNQWTRINPAMYAACAFIQDGDVRNVLPGKDGVCDYLETIGRTAFYGSNITQVNLSGYTGLSAISSGELTITSSLLESHPGAFEACEVEKVVLPKKEEGTLSIGEKSFYEDNAETVQVDLGSTTVIEKEAFGSCKGLETIDFPNTLQAIKDSSFSDCEKLSSVSFGKIEEIGDSAFSNCSQLVLTEQKNLPDTLKSIGESAFMDTSSTSFGKVYLGKSLTTIGKTAFKNSGLSDIEWNCPELTEIGNEAFSNTQLKDFALNNTKVKVIPQKMLFDCSKLQSASFGSEVGEVMANALAGTPDFVKLEFYSETVLDKDLFNAQGQQNKGYAASNNGGKITLQVNTTSDPIVVPLGREVTLPYYVSEYNASDNSTPFDYILLNKDAQTDEGKECIQVKTKTTGGYYWGVNNDSDDYKHKIQDEEYYVNTSTVPSITRKVKNQRQVCVVNVTGLQSTPENEPLKLKLVCKADFSIDNSAGYSLNVDRFEADYTIVVKDAKYYADLYKDADCSSPLTSGVQPDYQIVDRTMRNQRLYYKIAADESNSDIETNSYNVVVETDNPEVMYPAVNSGDTSENLSEHNNITVTNVNKDKIGNFYLKAAGVGTANIKVYPEGHEDCARTYTYKINSDVKTLTLSVPSEYAEGLEKDQSFCVLSQFTTMLMDDAVTDVEQYSKHTNWTLDFKVISDGSDGGEDTSSYVSLDRSTGVLKVLKQDVKNKRVTIQATAASPITDSKIEKTLNVTIKAGAPDIVEANTVTLYTNYRDSVQAAQEDIILKGSSAYTRKYYSLANKETGSEYLDTFEITIETSNADVLYPSDSSSGNKVTSLTTTTGTSDKGLYKIAYPNGQNFYLIAKSLGTAEIKVYPVGHPEYAQTYTFVVKAPDNQSGNNNSSNNNNNQPSSGNNSTTNNNSSNNNNQSGSNTSQTTVRTGQTIEDAASGTTAKVSKVAENGTGGEVTITNITNVNVTKVTIPTTVTVNGVSYQVTAISDNLFSGFKKLSTVILPANITAIGNGAFQNCKKLKKIVIPKGVQSIGANAFAGCKNLKLITVKTTTLKSVGSNAFKGIHKKAKIKVPKKQYKKYKKLLSNKGQKKSVKIKK